MHNWNWDDLRLILAVAEQRSLAGAARVLHVNHTTVLRRINAFERAYAIRLFDRLSSGYTVTDAAESLLSSARAMKDVVSELELNLIGEDLRLEGRVRIATCDTLMGSILPEILSGFNKAYPDIFLEVTTENFLDDLSQRNADVAIRTGCGPVETLIGNHIANIGFGLYAAKGFSESNSIANPINFNRWLAPDITFSGMCVYKWMSTTIPVDSVILKADSLLTLMQAAQGGLGVVILPYYLGDSTAGLERIKFESLVSLKTELWVLTHKSLRNTARVSALTSYVAGELRRKING